MSLVPTQVMVSVDHAIVTLGTVLLRKAPSVAEGDGQESNIQVIAASTMKCRRSIIDVPLILHQTVY